MYTIPIILAKRNLFLSLFFLLFLLWFPGFIMESIQQNDQQPSSYQNGSKINSHLEPSNHTSVQSSQGNITCSTTIHPSTVNLISEYNIVNWIICNDKTMTEEGYNCESRPLMTVLLVVSILVLLFLRKSSLIKVRR